MNMNFRSFEVSFHTTKMDTPPVCELQNERVEIQRASLKGRIVELPVDPAYRDYWTILGVQWINSKNEPSLLAPAILPKGWLSKDFPGRFSHMHCFELYDEEGIPRGTIFTRNAPESQWANVFLRTKEQGKKMLWVNEFTDIYGNCPDFSEIGILQLMASKK